MNGFRDWGLRSRSITPYVESDEDRERLLNRYRQFQMENHDRLMAKYTGESSVRWRSCASADHR